MAAGDEIETDLLVLGGGMAGLTTAALAAAAGASVVLVEKASRLGGSAVLSSGYLWTLPTMERFHEVVPGGSPELQQVVVDEFEAVVDWIGSTGTTVGARIPVLQGHGNQIDVAAYVDRCRTIVQRAGGEVVVDATVESLSVEDGLVMGATISDPSMRVSVLAPSTVLATGGFAHQPSLIGELIDPSLADVRVRCAPTCTGDGLRLARSVGAGDTGPAGFYGHLLGRGVDLSDVGRWDSFTLLHSRDAVLVGPDGRRLGDESLGDNVNAEALALRAGGRGLLVWDEQVHQDVLLVSWPPGYAAIDKFEVAIGSGATGTKAADLGELAGFADQHGFDGADLQDTIVSFNADVASRRAPGRHTVESPPFRALLVEPAITFPFAGLRCDDQGRVLDHGGQPLSGLYAAGVDIGGVYGGGYGGGLALASTFGMRVARSTGLVTA